MPELEIVPNTEHIFRSVEEYTSSYTVTFNIYGSNWFAIEIVIPDDPDFNALTRLDPHLFGNSYCENQFYHGTRAGFSRVLTNDESQWITTPQQRENYGWSPAVLGVDVPIVPGETIYCIIKCISWNWDGFCTEDVRIKPIGEDDYHCYYNGLPFILSDQEYTINFRAYGATDETFVADFDYNPKGILTDTFVSFTDLSTPELVPGDWIWEFGDGGWGYEQNPNHAYSAVGNYNCTLTATSVNATVSSKTKTIPVVDYLPEPNEFPWWLIGLGLAGVLGIVSLGIMAKK